MLESTYLPPDQAIDQALSGGTHTVQGVKVYRADCAVEACGKFSLLVPVESIFSCVSVRDPPYFPVGNPGSSKSDCEVLCRHHVHATV